MAIQEAHTPKLKLFTPDTDWLSLYSEEIIEPELEIIDPHHHLWDQGFGRYLGEELVDDLNAGHAIRATIFAECHSMYRADGPSRMRPVGETEFVVGTAERCREMTGTAIAAGIIGSIDLTLGAQNADVLDAHIAASRGRFVGIRGATAWHEDPLILNQPTTRGMLLDESVRRSIALASERGLSLDVWCFHTQLSEVGDLARSFPDLRIVLDHLGGPVSIGPYQGRRWEVFAAWRRDLAALAERPNIHIKIGGFGMRYMALPFRDRQRPPSSDAIAAACHPYLEAAIECFGPQRCILESNFPVDKVMCSYSVLWNAFKKMTSGYSPPERRQLFFSTAADVYRLAL